MTVQRSPAGSPPVAGRTGAGAAALLPRGHRRGVLALAGALFVVYATVSVLRHRAFETTAFDLGIFYDAVRDWAHFSLPHVAVKGVKAGFGPDFDLLGDHFHPILALLAPTFWVWPHPVTLLVDQAALMAASAVPVWAYAHRRLPSARAAYLFTVAYGLYWGLQEAVTFDFHEIAFAVPLIALAIERFDAGRIAAGAVAAALLALVKEDLPVLVAFVGLFLLLVPGPGRHRRPVGAALVVYGATAYALVTKVAMPALAGHPYVYWSFDRLGPDLPSALWHMVRHPLSTARLFVDPAVKWHTELMIFAPFAMLTLASPLLLLAVPLLAERFFSSGPQFWVTDFHYTATIAPIVAMGAADGFARLVRRLRGRRPGVAEVLARWVPVAVATTAVGLVGAFSFRELAAPRLWVGDAHVRAAAAAVGAVPRGAVVWASDEVQPHLADRDTALLFDGRPPPGPRVYAVVDVGRHQWPLSSVAAQRAAVDRLRSQGWGTVYARDRYVVLRAPVAGR